MQLAIDIGNSTIKAACFEGNHLVRHIAFPKDDALENTFAPWLAGLDITHVGLSSVVPDLTQRVCCMLSAHTPVPVLEIDHTVKLPFRIRYEYPERLGSDRIAAAAGARFIFGAQNIAIVDAGTALTIDALRTDGLFLGGSIAPGPELARNALASGTASLPEVQLELPATVLGGSTTEALQQGILYGMVDHVAGTLARLRPVLGIDLVVIATGGWHKLLAAHVPAIDHVDEHLVNRGICGLMALNAPSA